MEKGRLPSDVRGDLIIKTQEATNLEWGYIPAERPIEEHIKYGIINLDKPARPTSHEIVAWVKRILHLKKAGHGGTLDPGVTGILPIALESATKVVQSWLPAGKEYVCVMHLHKEVAPEKIETIFQEFTGPLYQRPPLRSSVKRRLRIRKVYYTDVLEISGKDILVRVGCEAGFYMRKLVHDIGEALGTGAHMLELRRTRAGPFKEDETFVTLLNLVDAYHYWKEDGDEHFLRKVIQPVEYGLIHLPKFYIRDSAVDAICHGAKLTAPGVLKLSDDIKPNITTVIMTQKGEAVAIAEATMTSKEIIELDHGIVANTRKVIMSRSTYPSWSSFKK